MKALRCCAVVALLNLVSGSDFLQRSSVAHLSLVKNPKLWDARNVRKRSLPVTPENRKLSVGTADPGDSCGALREYDATLNNNTHPYIFKDLSGSVSLAWVGDATGVILALTTYQVPIFMLRFGQSKLYRSTNYGKSFDDVTNLINNTFIRSEFGIAVGPENSGKVILTADVSGNQDTSRIFLSRDFGNSFLSTDLPFEPVTQISYNPSDSDALLAVSAINDLWLSEDFGKNWRNIHHSVCLVKWGRNGAIFFTTSLNRSCSDRGMLELRRTTDYGKTFKTLGTKIYSFGVGGGFLFASVMADSGTLRVIHVSLDQGEVWNIAQLPAVGHEQFYSILAASDDMVFMHVDEPGDSGFGTIYVSDDRGVVYSKSLERHLYSTTGGDTDFTNITSLRGVFMTTVLAEDGSLQTVVTFDQGGEWRPLQKPAESGCDAPFQSQEQCTFHIHASYSISTKLNVPMLPLTEPNAVGLILAHGSMGDTLSVMEPDVYVSDDGGYSWQRALKGPHHYAILDSGGLLVAVEHTPSQTIQQIKFSTDEGQCWHVYNFTKEPIYFSGLASEPGARSMNVSLWGYREYLFSQFWVSITIDFEELLNRDCDTKDYVEWLAHSDDISDPNDGCILGYKEKFLRLRKDSVCLNGRNYAVNKQPLPCQCTLDDFLCDFGYYRLENSSECVEQPDLQGKVLEFCLQGKMEQLQTKGYRKIPGDKCVGGVSPERKVIDLSSKCVSNILVSEKQMNSSPSSTALIIVVVICTLLISVAAGVLFIKRYVCGGRFLVHRYSVLQQHADANGIETADALDTCAISSSRRQYHDDSDEDLLD